MSAAVAIPDGPAAPASRRRAAADTPWALADFRDGVTTVLAAVYRDHYADVAVAVGRYVRGADAETVVHEVFFKIIQRPATRASFRGGSMTAWIKTVAANQARDHLRRSGRERPVTPATALSLAEDRQGPSSTATDRWLPDFCAAAIRPEWRPIFEARFLAGLTQREAAVRLGVSRTTLAYREGRIRRHLRRSLRKAGYHR